MTNAEIAYQKELDQMIADGKTVEVYRNDPSFKKLAVYDLVYEWGSAVSCGVHQISGVSTFRPFTAGSTEMNIPLLMMKNLCQRIQSMGGGHREKDGVFVPLLEEPAKVWRNSAVVNAKCAFLVFSDTIRGEGVKGGTGFANFIREKNFGTLMETEALINPNSTNLIKVWVWAPDWAAIKAWIALEENLAAAEAEASEEVSACFEATAIVELDAGVPTDAPQEEINF